MSISLNMFLLKLKTFWCFWMRCAFFFNDSPSSLLSDLNFNRLKVNQDEKKILASLNSLPILVLKSTPSGTRTTT